MVPSALVLAVAASLSFRLFEVVVPPEQSEWIWSYYSGNKLAAARFQLGILPALVAVYILNAGLFVCIGQKLGQLMERFRPITAYTINIAGSIAGIVAFASFSFLGGRFNSPVVWFACGSVAWLWFFRESWRRFAPGAACALVACALVGFGSAHEIWSPYYNIQLRPEANGAFNLYVNKFFHQRAINFDFDPRGKAKYGLPYDLKAPQKLLVLGTGTGNDLAVAAMHGVPHIQAVEIDPVIARLGRELHPNHPYSNPNLRVAIDDARSFLQRTQEKYDMIVLGTLDSHALLSGMSTVRLDNFVYTLQSFQAIQRHLNKNGIAVLMFSVPVEWLGQKLLGMCRAAFHDPPPLVYVGDNYLFNLMVVAGPGLTQGVPYYLRGLPFRPITGEPDLKDLPSDDWPYLYLSGRAIPSHYLKAVGILVVLSILAIAALCPVRGGRAEVNFFSLGCAFLLLETKSVTTLSLLFGSTWLVNAFVFGAILAMILLANLLTMTLEIRRMEFLYLGLGLSLLFNYFLPLEVFLNEGFWLRSLLSSFATALPLFFAALVFAHHFKSARQIGSVFGVNLMGAVLGGFLEYSSMAIGLNNLYLLAFAFYALSYAAARGNPA